VIKRILFLIVFFSIAFLIGHFFGYCLMPKVRVDVFNKEQYEQVLASHIEDYQKNKGGLSSEDFEAHVKMEPVAKLGHLYFYFNPENEDYAIMNTKNDKPIIFCVTKNGRIDLSFYGLDSKENLYLQYGEKNHELRRSSLSFSEKGSFPDIPDQTYMDTNGDNIIDKWFDFKNRLNYTLDGLQWVKDPRGFPDGAIEVYKKKISQIPPEVEEGAEDPPIKN
jgi:hypothetical protein